VRAILTEAEPLRSAIRVITAPPASTDGIAQESFAGLKHKLEFRDVSFRYSGSEYRSLNNVSFWISPGDLVAIAGPSGCGKTTLVNLLARLYQPESGVILVDGVSIERISRASWFARLAFAGQDVDLIDGDIVKNVQFGRNDLSREAVLEALTIVEADEFLPRLPRGIDSVIGDRGMVLSGGQRQRIGLARAVVGKPDILVLDEATNAIDLEMEARIFIRLREALPDSTLIVITHRENISQADLWIRMEWGEVAGYLDAETPSAS
jgi:ATP-binding cassette subfamily B protein